MKFANAFSVLALMFLSVLFTGCPGEEPPTGPTGPTSGTVTIYTKSMTASQTPVAGLTVAINDETGELVDTGETDSAGTFVATDVPANSSATVVSESTELGKLMLTKFGLQPEKSYTFNVLRESPVVATVTVTLTNLPFDSVYQSIYVGGSKCSAQSGVPLSLKAECVQSDGKVSIYATAFDAQNRVVGQALKLDLPLTAVITQTIDDWYVVTSNTVQVNLANAPYDLSSSATYINLAVQRRDSTFPLGWNQIGTANANAFTGTTFAIPTTLAAPENGHGYLLKTQSTAVTQAGTRVDGFIIRTQSFPTLVQYGLDQWLPALQARRVWADLADATRPAMGWELTGEGSVDAVMALMSWTNNGNNVNWLTTMPAGDGYAQLPQLPASMTDFLPPSGGLIQGPILFTAEASWCAGYDEFAATETPLTIFDYGDFYGAEGNAVLKFSGAAPNDVVFKTTGGRLNRLPVMSTRAHR